jgi:hypothetical protein
MAAGNTYTQIASTTLGSAAASVTFSSISGAYTDLVLIANVGSNDDAQVFSCRINSDTASNYSITQLLGQGSVAVSGRESSQTKMNISKGVGVTTTNGGMVVISNFNNYANATTYKTVLSRVSESVGTYLGTEATVGLWRSTAAITAIELSLNNGVATFNTGSTFNLYGITAA